MGLRTTRITAIIAVITPRIGLLAQGRGTRPVLARPARSAASAQIVAPHVRPAWLRRGWLVAVRLVALRLYQTALPVTSACTVAAAANVAAARTAVVVGPRHVLRAVRPPAPLAMQSARASLWRATPRQPLLAASRGETWFRCGSSLGTGSSRSFSTTSRALLPTRTGCWHVFPRCWRPAPPRQQARGRKQRAPTQAMPLTCMCCAVPRSIRRSLPSRNKRLRSCVAS